MENSLGVKAGEEVLIGIPESSMLKAAILVYLIPMFALIIGAIIGSILPWRIGPNLGAVLGATILFGLSILLVVFFGKRSKDDETLHPVMLARLKREGDISSSCTPEYGGHI